MYSRPFSPLAACDSDSGWKVADCCPKKYQNARTLGMLAILAAFDWKVPRVEHSSLLGYYDEFDWVHEFVAYWAIRTASHAPTTTSALDGLHPGATPGWCWTASSDCPSWLSARSPLKVSGGRAGVSFDQPSKLLIAWLTPHDRLGGPSGGSSWPCLAP